MRKTIFIVTLFLCSFATYAQILTESQEGTEIVGLFQDVTTGAVFGKVNINDKSMELKGIFKDDRWGTWSIGVKGSATNSITSLFTKGSLSPGASVNIAYSKFNIVFDSQGSQTDFFSFRIDYNANKQVLFDSQQTYTKQVNEENFKGGVASLSYGVLLSGEHLIGFALGWAWKNNYSRLDEIEFREYRTDVSDSLKSTREYGKTTIGRIGNYRAYEAFPMKLSYTLVPSHARAYKDKLLLGLASYYSSDFGNFTPTHNIGLIVLITKQDTTSGIRAPIINIGFQLNDVTENITRSTFLNMISVNLTTAFNIFTL